MANKLYTILSDVNTPIPPRTISGRWVNILIPIDSDRDAAAAALKQAARDLTGDNDEVVIYAYLEDQAQAWRGYVAKVTAGAGQTAKLLFDNDPLLRDALQEDLNT